MSKKASVKTEFGTALRFNPRREFHRFSDFLAHFAYRTLKGSNESRAHQTMLAVLTVFGHVKALEIVDLFLQFP